jgi:hypothetical protein
MDRWSLQAVGAPIYPQNRFQIGIALDLAEAYELEDDILVIVESAADRFTGKRSSQVFEGMTALKNKAAHYWLNSVPRNRFAASRR